MIHFAAVTPSCPGLPDSHHPTDGHTRSATRTGTSLPGPEAAIILVVVRARVEARLNPVEEVMPVAADTAIRIEAGFIHHLRLELHRPVEASSRLMAHRRLLLRTMAAERNTNSEPGHG